MTIRRDKSHKSISRPDSSLPGRRTLDGPQMLALPPRIKVRQADARKRYSLARGGEIDLREQATSRQLLRSPRPQQHGNQQSRYPHRLSHAATHHHLHVRESGRIRRVVAVEADRTTAWYMVNLWRPCTERHRVAIAFKASLASPLAITHPLDGRVERLPPCGLRGVRRTQRR